MPRILNLLPWRRRTTEHDLDRELRYHVDRRVEDLKRSGMNEDEARRAAALEFGNIAQVKEDVREAWMWRWLDDLGRDLRYALRMLWRSPGFTSTALISLALGIGANTAIFSLIDQVIVRSLPVKEPERLVHLGWVGNSLSSSWGGGHLISQPLCQDLEEQNQVFDGFFCRRPTQVILSTGQEHSQVRAEVVSGSYFSALGATPKFGRLINRSDDIEPEAHPVVVLSYNYWKNNLRAAPDIVGSKILINNYPMTVIGIASASFVGIDPFAVPTVWIPAMMIRQVEPEVGRRMSDRRAVWLHGFGRIKADMTAEQAEARLLPWFQRMLELDTRREGFPSVSAEERGNFLRSTIDLLPVPGGLSNLRDGLARPLLVLSGGTLLLLVLASLNVAGLLLARGAARSRELTTRLAIGATRARITGQLLAEILFITLGGALLGLLAAPAVTQGLFAFLSYSDDLSPRIDYRVFLFAFLASMLICALCGVASAFQASRIPLVASLKESSRLATTGGVRLRKALVVGQMALTLLLLIGAGLFVQTLAHLHEKVGFESSSLLMFGLNPPSSGYSNEDAERVMREVYRRLPQIPGVESSALANTRLLSGGWSATILTVQSDERIVSERPVPYMRVSPGFFPTLGTQVIIGRDFDERDVRAPGTELRGWQSAIVNESFARKYFKDRNPVGSRLGLGNRPDTPTNIEIIGVVRDFSRRNLRDEGIEQAFFPYWDRLTENGSFYVKMRGESDAAFASIRTAVAEVDPTLPVVEPITFEDQIGRSLRNERALATLSGGFGVIALLLSVVGLYGVMAFVVTQRTQEIGVRMALGATRTATVWLIVREALVMIVAGTAIALPGTWVLRRLVESQLFGIPAFDVPTIVAASGFLALVALAAAMVPAWRAASVDPTNALRLE